MALWMSSLSSVRANKARSMFVELEIRDFTMEQDHLTLVVHGSEIEGYTISTVGLGRAPPGMHSQ